MTWNDFIDHIVREGRFDDRHLVEKAAIATMTVLGERLPGIDARAVADRLPDRLAGPLRAGHHEGGFDRDGFFDRVARLTALPVGRAVEHATVICHVLARSVGGEGHTHLVQHLPDDLAGLFEPDEARPYHPPAPGPHHRARDLAHARAGSRHPIAEGRPYAHANSVVESDDPHGDSKLSSGRTTQERDRATMAAGKPGSSKPISESED